MNKYTRFGCLLCLGMALAVGPVMAEDAQSKADSAVANILFDYDGAETYATYVVSEDGFVDIIFASNIPSQLYVDILDKLNSHPDIDGVLSGTSGPACDVF